MSLADHRDLTTYEAYAGARGVAEKGRSMTTVFMHSIKSLQQTFAARAGEWALAIITFNIGFVFLYNETLFVDNPTRWSELTAWASQSTWGYIAMGLGTLRLIVLIINGSYWRTPHLRTFFAFLSCFFWWWLVSGLLGNLSVAAAVMPVLLGFDAYNVLRVGREIGVAEYLHRLRKHQRNAELKH